MITHGRPRNGKLTLALVTGIRVANGLCSSETKVCQEPTIKLCTGDREIVN